MQMFVILRLVEIKYIVPTDKFEHDVRKVRDKGLKEKLQKQIEEAAAGPNFGNPSVTD